MASLSRRAALALTAATIAGLAAHRVEAASSAEAIDARIDRALEELFATVAGARDLYDNAKGVLVMPGVVSGGLLIGGAYGEGALRINGQSVAYYSMAAASIGFQIGIQSTKQALFFMTDRALERFRAADGWEIGADAQVTFPGDGIGVNLRSTTVNAPIVAVVFGQDGLLAGASLQGAKYSLISR